MSNPELNKWEQETQRVNAQGILVCIQGRAQVGKTTIAKYLQEKYSWGRIDAGDPFKALIGMGLPKFGYMVRTQGRQEAYNYLKENYSLYLESYEKKKKYASRNPRTAQEFRDLTIAIAEFTRCFFPDVWPKGSLMMGDKREFNVSFAQDLDERLDYGRYHGGRFFDIQLNCVDHGEDDTRRPFNLDGLNSMGAIRYTYRIRQSLQVAEHIRNSTVDRAYIGGYNHLISTHEIKEVNLT
ncbi:hypothetical protein AHIS2_p025 [Acaryochloris phage A-HIS2]|nr:hypothetical protein AHIS2_p025 [Acaryochloris phage A-HIS2]